MRTVRWPALILALTLLTVPVGADEMQDAMDRADALNLFLRINLQPDQARQMVSSLQRIQELVQTYRSGRTQSLNSLSPTLRRARQRLIAGDQLTEETISALDNYREQRQRALENLYRQVAAEMQAIAGILSPDQNQYLDWTPPASIRPEEALQERLEAQRIAMGRVQEAAEMIDSVKHLDTLNFITGRGPMINDYLALYFRPDSQQFEQAFELVINYTDRARMLTEEEWQARGLDIAAEMVSELGLMPTMDPGRRPGTIAWGDLFDLVTNSQTLVAARNMAR